MSDPAARTRPGRATRDGLSRARLWVFRLSTAVLAPVLFVALVEGALRVAGFGYATSFTLPAEVAGRERRIDNPSFAWKFFPPRIARFSPSFSFAAEKSPGKVRVFVLGASAAQGDPEPAYAFSRVLQVLLEHRHPGVDVEVVNTAITAINSHVVVSIAEEVARYDPDVLVVYLGNNEVVGPYGPGTVFSKLDRSRAWIRLRIAALDLRIAQAIQSLTRRGGVADLDRWQGMEMFLERTVRHDDPRLDTVHDHFRANLEAIVDAGLDAGAAVVVSTIAVNLRDSAPFASLHADGLDDDDLARFDRRIVEADTAVAAGDAVTALARLAEAEAIDDDWAGLHYRLGRVLQTRGQVEDVRARFERARDLDALRFRADAAINDIVQTVADARSRSAVVLADTEVRVADASPGGIPGDEWFVDHVHFGFAGNALVGRVIAEAVEGALPDRLGRPPERSPPLSDDALRRRLAFTEYDAWLVATEMARRFERAPFTGQAGHDRDVARLRDSIEEAEARLRAGGIARSLDAYARAVAEAPDDPTLRFRYGKLLAETGDAPGAAVQFRAFVDALPHDVPGRERLSSVLAATGRFDEAIEVCRSLRRDRPEFVPPYYTEAYALANTQRYEDSLALYRRLLEIDPSSAKEIWTEIAKIERALGRDERARDAESRASSP